MSEKSVLLIGPRQTGKTRLIKETLKQGIAFYNLPDAEIFFRLSNDLTLLRKQLAAHPPASRIVVIDEARLNPLSYVELGPELFDLRKALNGGLMPSIYLSEKIRSMYIIVSL